MNDIYRIEDGKMIIGKTIPAFIENAGLHLVDLKVYQDGKIDCWRTVDIDGLRDMIKSGWVRTSISGSAEFSMFPLGYMRSGELVCHMKEDELVKDVQDIINDLNDKPTSLKICKQVFTEFLENPTEENKTRLKTAYENMPEHNRRYVLGDMDVDDIPIRVIIYGVDGEKNDVKYMHSKEKINRYLAGEIRN